MVNYLVNISYFGCYGDTTLIDRSKFLGFLLIRTQCQNKPQKKIWVSLLIEGKTNELIKSYWK